MRGGSKSKKKATESLSALKRHLRHDGVARGLLDDVTSWLGELRRDKSSLKAKNDSLSRRFLGIRDEAAKLHGEMDYWKGQLDHTVTLHRQVSSSLVRAEKEIEELEMDLVDPCVDPDKLDLSHVPDAKLGDAKKVMVLFKQLRKRLRKSPVPAGVRENVRVYEVSDIVTDYDRTDQYTTLGMFVVLLTVIGLDAGFVFEDGDLSGPFDFKPGTVKQRDAFIRWMEDSIRATPLEKKCRVV